MWIFNWDFLVILYNIDFSSVVAMELNCGIKISVKANV
jgi:hypothetical protein